jgi:hypothetical protein
VKQVLRGKAASNKTSQTIYQQTKPCRMIFAACFQASMMERAERVHDRFGLVSSLRQKRGRFLLFEKAGLKQSIGKVRDFGVGAAPGRPGQTQPSAITSEGSAFQECVNVRRAFCKRLHCWFDMDPQQLRQELQEASTPDLRERRAVIGFSLLGMASMAAVKITFLVGGAAEDVAKAEPVL